jgi:hypothetical protein
MAMIIYGNTAINPRTMANQVKPLNNNDEAKRDLLIHFSNTTIAQLAMLAS